MRGEENEGEREREPDGESESKNARAREEMARAREPCTRGGSAILAELESSGSATLPLPRHAEGDIRSAAARCAGRGMLTVHAHCPNGPVASGTSGTPMRGSRRQVGKGGWHAVSDLQRSTRPTLHLTPGPTLRTPQATMRVHVLYLLRWVDVVGTDTTRGQAKGV